MLQIDDWKKILKKSMSEKRYIHSCNVADTARELAKIHGYDENKAYLAGLLHDICKEYPKEKQLEFVKKSDLDVSSQELDTYKLWHGIAGAYLLKTEYNITDEEFLKSIRYHTVARDNMSMLEEIVYVADMVSADREMPCVHGIRALAKENLKLAVLSELQYSINSTIQKAGLIPKSTLKAYNCYVEYIRN